jgi:hypothetical protein
MALLPSSLRGFGHFIARTTWLVSCGVEIWHNLTPATGILCMAKRMERRQAFTLRSIDYLDCKRPPDR